MTPDDAIATLKLIQAYWPKTAWHADIIKHVHEYLEKKMPIEYAQAVACLQELRTTHGYNTIKPVEVLARLKLIAYPSAGSGPTPATTRPTLDKHEVANIRRRTPEFHDWTDWRICAHWFSGVNINRWLSLDHWRQSIAFDLKYHGLDVALIPDCIADTEREHFNAIPKPQWVIDRERAKADGSWYKKALGVDVLPTTGLVAQLIAKMRAKGDDALVPAADTRGMEGSKR